MNVEFNLHTLNFHMQNDCAPATTTMLSSVATCALFRLTYQTPLWKWLLCAFAFTPQRRNYTQDGAGSADTPHGELRASVSRSAPRPDSLVIFKPLLCFKYARAGLLRDTFFRTTIGVGKQCVCFSVNRTNTRMALLYLAPSAPILSKSKSIRSWSYIYARPKQSQTHADLIQHKTYKPTQRLHLRCGVEAASLSVCVC